MSSAEYAVVAINHRRVFSATYTSAAINYRMMESNILFFVISLIGNRSMINSRGVPNNYLEAYKM